MLRLGRLTVLATTLPVFAYATYAGLMSAPAPQPCIVAGGTAFQLAASPSQAQTRVAFTADAARATLQVRLIDSADRADFVLVDDSETAETASCPGTAAIRTVGIADAPLLSTDPLVHLARGEGDADYRIYVRSRRISPLSAAALLVAARHDDLPALLPSRVAQAAP